MILNCFIFISTLFLFLYLPAKAVCAILKIEKSEDVFTDFGITIALGIVFLTIISLIFRCIGLDFRFLWVLPMISSIYIYSSSKKSKKTLFSTKQKLKFREGLFILTIIILVIITQNLVLFRGGWRIKEGRVFPSTHDTMWSIAIVGELTNHFPPQHPGMSGEPLKNHHFFYPFFLAIIKRLTNIDTFDIYFRLVPPIVSLLFALSLYTLSGIFTRNIFFRGLTVFLGVFSGNFAYFVPLFLGKNFDWKGNTFFSDQPFDQIINPYSVLGFSFFLFSIYAFFKSTNKAGNLEKSWSLICALFIGTLFGFKSFGGVIVVSALGLTTFYYLLVYKKLKFLILPLLTAILFLPIFFFIMESDKSSLSWFPGWLLTEMVSGQDKLNLVYFAQIESYYRSIHNILGMVKIRLIEFLVYLVGNLGVRLIGLIYLLKLVFFDRKSSDTNMRITNVYIFFCFMIAFFIPLLFNLGSNVYNIVQFTPYALIILAVLTSVFLQELFFKLKKMDKLVLGILLVFLIILLAIPVNVKNVISKLEHPSELISDEEFEALTFLKKNTDSSDILLIDPEQYGLDPMYVSAISERRIYLASPGYATQTGKNPSERMKNIRRFFSELKNNQFLLDNNIAYVYLLKPYQYQRIEKNIAELHLQTVFENNKTIVLKVGR